MRGPRGGPLWAGVQWRVTIERGVVRRIAGDGGTAGGNKVLHTGAAGGFEQVESALDVRVDVELWLLDGGAHAGAGGQMDDGVKMALVEDFGHKKWVGDVSLAEFDLGAERLEIFALDGGVVVVVEAVEDGDLARVVTEQALDSVGADKSSPSSDKNVHEAGIYRQGQDKCKT